MRQIIIALVAIVLFTNNYAQSGLDSNLLALEKQLFESANDTGKAMIRLKKIGLYIAANDYSEHAFTEMRRIDFSLLQDSIVKSTFLWNATLLSQLNKKTDYAKYYLNQYHSLCKDSSLSYHLLGLLIYQEDDSIMTNNFIEKLTVSDSGFTCLKCLLEARFYERKHKNLYLAASVAIPGLGTSLNGNVFKGLNSLLVNSAIGYGVYSLALNGLYANAVLVGLTYGTKFYLGNLKLTSLTFQEKENKQKSELAKKCEFALSNLMNKYPLKFRQ